MVLFTPASISVHFIVDDSAMFKERPAGPIRIRAVVGDWEAVRVRGYSGEAKDGSGNLFDCAMVVCRCSSRRTPIAATRLVLAGSAWHADTTIDGNPVAVRSLSRDIASPFDKRMAIVLAGKLDHDTIADLGCAAGFVSGVELRRWHEQALRCKRALRRPRLVIRTNLV